MLGFCCLLRTIEAIDLRVRDDFFLERSDKALLLLENSKGANRTGVPENVVCDVPIVVAAFKDAVKHRQPNEFIYRGNQTVFSQTLRRFAEMLEVPTSGLTPYTMR